MHPKLRGAQSRVGSQSWNSFSINEEQIVQLGCQRTVAGIYPLLGQTFPRYCTMARGLCSSWPAGCTLNWKRIRSSRFSTTLQGCVVAQLVAQRCTDPAHTYSPAAFHGNHAPFPSPHPPLPRMQTSTTKHLCALLLSFTVRPHSTSFRSQCTHFRVARASRIAGWCAIFEIDHLPRDNSSH